MKRLENKVIVLAGSGAIGGACAHRYANEGAAVLIGDMDAKAATSVADEICAAGGSAVGVELDGTSEESIAAMVARAVSEFGGIDGLHANFASFADGSANVDLLDMELDVYDEEMRVDARGFLLVSRHAIPELRKRGGGSIVNQSSTAAWMGISGFYGLAKAGLNFLTTSLAHELGHRNIRINAVAPGPTDTAAMNKQVPVEFQDPLVDSLAIKRLGTPDDHVGPVLFLLSDEAGWMTGQIVAVDGGQVTRL